MRGKIIGLFAIVSLLAAFAPTPSAFAESDPGDQDELRGVIESLPSSTGLVGDWIVSGVTVHVTTDTEIDDDLAAIEVGASVEIKGIAEADDTFTATEVEGTEEADDDRFGELHLEGFVEALPDPMVLVGDWIVSGVTVHVTTDTRIEEEHGVVAVGSAVEVEGLGEADGSITARKIEVADPEDIDDDSMMLLGTVGAFPRGDHVGTWRVSHHRVRVRRSTRVVHARRLSQGSVVRVFGTVRADGTLRAAKVVVKS